ncbi:MAG: diaminopimelate decarboxylase [Acetobacteraceae bacterium]|nr:diaminopimelate decarboxylase [Acetobacteraceae bacterium]
MAAAPDDNTPDPSIAELIAARPHLRMHAMDGLTMEDVPLGRIADEVGTPTWIYSAGALRARYRALTGALKDAGLDAHPHYAVKANDHLAILSLLRREGAGADVVSEGELLRARAAGIPASRIVYSGVGKSERELRLALTEDIGQINVESGEELRMLSAIAVSMDRIARVVPRINPDVDAGTHEKISTGRARDKFGIPFDEAIALYAEASRLPGIEPVGIATHIGSQIMDLAPYRAAFGRIAELVRALREKGHTVRVVDCGGGLGIPYRNQPGPSLAGLAGVIKAAFHNLDVRVALEPGRWLVGPTGVLLASVILQKQASGARFVVLDAAMNDLVRPAMYDAWHGIVPVGSADAAGPVSPGDVVGPVCESSDTFARGRLLPDLGPGALVAILDAGAYGSVMSSPYNARPRAAEVLVDGSDWTVIRARQPHSALWADEIVPA